MLARTLTRCLSVFFITFSMYPDSTSPSAPVGNQQEYYHAIRKPSSPRFAESILRDVNKPKFRQTKGSSLKRRESGFDITEEEMKRFKLWDKGVIPFYIDVPSFSDKVLRDRIRWFLNEVNAATSLNFVELPRPPTDYNKFRWVFFVNRRGQLGCADNCINNFTNEGVQRVVLGYDCISTGGGLAEVVLAIAGVPPQHNAPNRDRFIKILDENIFPEKIHLFKKLEDNEWLFHDIKYDFQSAGHFHQHKYSINGRASIEAKSAYEGITIGEQRGFSPDDILKIKMLYNYMVLKNKDKMPACSKLFSRGKNFNKVPPDSNENLKPLRKPNRYLGIQSDGDIGDNSKPGEDNGEDLKDPENDKHTSQEENNENDQHSQDNSSQKTGRHHHQNTVNETSLKTAFVDPLTYLSDYQTDDQNLQNAWRKNREYKNFGKVADILKMV